MICPSSPRLCDAGRAALLLPAADAVRERVVGAHVVELGGRLVVPAAPRLAAVHGDHRALVRREDHDRRAVGVDPDALIVVAPRSAAQGGERLPAVGGLPGDDGRDVDDVRVLRVHANLGRVARARDDPRVGVHASPALPGVIRAVDPGARPRLDGRVQPPRVARRHRDPDPAQALRERRQARLDRPPAPAAVRRLEEPASLTGERGVLPGPLPRLPQDRVDRARVAGAERHVGGAGVLVEVEDLLERVPAVGRAVDPPLLVRPVRVAENGDEEALLVPRVHDDLRDLLPVAQAEVLPGLPAVHRLVDDRRPSRGRAAACPRRCRRRSRPGSRAPRRARRSTRSAGRRRSAATSGRSPSSSRRRRSRRRCRRGRACRARRSRPSCARRGTGRSAASAARRRAREGEHPRRERPPRPM